MIENKLREQILELKEKLPNRVDPAFISHKSKVPYKVVDLRVSLMYRAYELANDSFTLLCKKKIASGTLLARGLVETVSVFWYLCLKMETCIDNKSISEFDSTVMKLLLGSRNGITDESSINIMTIIDKIDKQLEGYKFCYELLCEFAHPNWKGTHGLYGKINFEEFYTDFGFNITNESKRDTSSLLMPVATSLEILDVSMSKFDKIIDDFIKICDDEIDNR